MTRTLQYGQAATAYNPYYRHSGRIGLAGPILGFVAGLPAAVLLAFAYSYADIYLPYAYLNAALCLGFGAALGAVPGFVLRAAKVRNLSVSLAVTMVVTLAGFYASWVAWECGVLDEGGGSLRKFTYLELAEQPLGVARLAEFINERGTWALTSGRTYNGKPASPGENVKGVSLAVVWAAEALLIGWTAWVVGRRFAGGLPFCERCERWAERPTWLAQAAPADPALLRQTIEAGDYTYLASRVGADNGRDWWRVEHHRCAGCDQFHTITVTDVRLQNHGRGRTSEKKKVLINRLLVSAEQLQSLRTLLTGPPRRPLAPPDPPPTNR